ncbi:MAG: copper chaperone CopZ [Candidatus Promineifilaceae bacterium]|jgi:copper chaperone CopZ
MWNRVVFRIVVVCVVLVGVSGLSTGCRKRDIRVAAIQVPGMKSEACSKIVLGALAREQGIKGDVIDINIEQRMLEIKYDSLKLSLKNLEYTISRAGFAANEIPADAKAKAALPEGCR